MMADSSLINIDREQVLHNLGYAVNSSPPARVINIVNKYIKKLQNMIQPSYSYVIKEVEWVEGSRALLSDSIILDSSVIAGLLKQCSKAAIMIVTIGRRLDENVLKLAEEGLVLESATLDAIGTAAIEKLASFVQEVVGKKAKSQGLATSRRFSPGYCDWSINQQEIVFRTLENESTNVELTDSYLMLPQKSLSGIIGVGTCGKADKYNPCITCKKYDCIGRRYF